MTPGLRLPAMIIAFWVGFSAAAAAGPVTLPEFGRSFEFTCGGKGWSENHLALIATLKSIDGDIARIELSEDGRPFTWLVPTANWVLAFFTKESKGKRTVERFIDWGSLSFAELAVGEKVSAWVRQSDSRYGRSRWKWSAKIIDKTTARTPEIGALEVFVIEEDKFSAEWDQSNKTIIHYSPTIGFITYWKEVHSNGQEMECRMTTPAVTFTGKK